MRLPRLHGFLTTQRSGFPHVLQNEWGNGMGMSRRTRETLIDLVEIKLSCLEVSDREDARELANLECCLGELRKAMSGKGRRAAV